jgi:EAL and modified HD-GYP domain-containing signal transduction protein
MVGIMSLMPALLGVVMEEILAQLPVDQRVKQALTDFGGPLGELLQLVEATEQTDVQATEDAMQRLPALGAQFVSTSIAQALAWANNLGCEKG